MSMQETIDILKNNVYELQKQLQELYKDKSVYKDWGSYEVLDKYYNSKGSISIKVKILRIKPDGVLSMQKHFHRSEVWLVTSGHGIYYSKDDHGNRYIKNTLNPTDLIVVKEEEWHQLVNTSNKYNLVIHEIQYGEECSEEDILREDDHDF